MDSDPKAPESGNGLSKDEELLLEQELGDIIDVQGSNPDNDTPPTTAELECSKCGTKTNKVCPTCRGPFCAAHQSILDPTFCSMCMDDAVNTLKVSEGLKDSEGANHHGRELKPEGPIFGSGSQSICSRIAQMSEEQLKGHIDYYKDLIRQAERSLDFRRTVLGAAQIELNQREDQIRRHFPKSRVGKTAHLKDPSAPQTASQKRDNKDPSKTLAQALNMSPEQSAKFMAAFGELLKMAPSAKPKGDKK